MALATNPPEIDYSQLDRDTLLEFEAYAVEDLKFYTSFQARLEQLSEVKSLQPYIPHNLDLVQKCEIRLEMIRKALTPYVH